MKKFLLGFLALILVVVIAAGAMLVLAVVYAIQIARPWHTATANPIEMIKTE